MINGLVFQGKLTPETIGNHSIHGKKHVVRLACGTADAAPEPLLGRWHFYCVLGVRTSQLGFTWIYWDPPNVIRTIVNDDELVQRRICLPLETRWVPWDQQLLRHAVQVATGIACGAASIV